MAAIAALGGSCGTGPAGDAATPEPQGTNFVGISAVEGEADDRLDVLTDPLPTAGSGRCQTTVSPRAVETENEVTVYIDIDKGPAPPFEGCALAPRRTTLDLASPVGERRVTDGFGSTFAFRDGRWSGCDHVVMTCVTAPAACDNGTLRATISNADVPRRFGLSNQRCAAPFAVADVDYGAAACPASGDGENPCAGKQVRRQFWRIEGSSWVLVASTTEAGCGPALPALAEFDRSLCADLPAPGR